MDAMDEREVLTKAIEKAKLNGLDKSATLNWEKQRIDYSWGSIGEGYFIFDHDFAKAFWGEHWLDVDYPFYANDIRYDGKIIDETTKYVANIHITSWQYHLQQMVLAPNKVMYMKDFLDDLSEHDLEMIKEGHQRSDRDTRRGE